MPLGTVTAVATQEFLHKDVEPLSSLNFYLELAFALRTRCTLSGSRLGLLLGIVEKMHDSP